MAKKRLYQLIVNELNTSPCTLNYTYNKVPITLDLGSDKGRIDVFTSSIKKPILYGLLRDNLFNDSIRKLLVSHMLKYGRPLRIHTIELKINNHLYRLYDSNQGIECPVWQMLDIKQVNPKRILRFMPNSLFANIQTYL